MIERSPLASLYFSGAKKAAIFSLLIFLGVQLLLQEIQFGWKLLGLWFGASILSALYMGIVSGLYSARLDANLTARRLNDPNDVVITGGERLWGAAMVLSVAAATVLFATVLKNWIY